MTRVTIHAGVCGFETRMEAVSENMQHVDVTIDSDCPDIQAAAEKLGRIDAYQEVFARVGQGQVYQTFGEHCRHAACPVPMAVIKAIEAEANLALPREISFRIEKERT